MPPRNIVHCLASVLLALLLAPGIAAWHSDVQPRQADKADSQEHSETGDSLLNTRSFLPAYDSGWFAIGVRPDPLFVFFDHQLGGDPDDYLVTLMCKDDTSLATYDCVDQQFRVNAHWYALTSTSVKVWVAATPRPDEIRVRIYTEVPADDSDWIPLLARPDPVAVPYDHMLLGEPDDYLVSLQCKDDTALATYGCRDLGFNVDADWYDLTNTSVTLWVQSSPQPDEVRVRVFLIDPDYDSGWYAIGVRPDPLAVPFDHNLGGDADSYVVSLECKDSSSLNTYNCTSFNFTGNAHWFDLNGTSIQVWVASSMPDEIRVRIWKAFDLIFSDGFESGDTSAWSSSAP